MEFVARMKYEYTAPPINIIIECFIISSERFVALILSINLGGGLELNALP